MKTTTLTNPVAVFKDIGGTSAIYINGVRLDNWSFNMGERFLQALVDKINAASN